MAGVFLSYRRDDTSQDARRIHDRLADRFGEDLVYIDVEDIPLGVDFLAHITEALRTASYVLVAIGPRWLLVTDEAGRQRLKDPEDPVRYEIKTALQQGRLVVPMLIGGARMPPKRELPSEIAALVRHNGIAIRPDPDFESDLLALMDGLHLERMDESRVPTVFRVGLVARHLGYGGAVGWGLLGLTVALLALEESGTVGVALSVLMGLLVGWLGGSLVGYLTGLLIRHKAPPLVARQVRRMGIVWSLGLTFAIAIATGLGVLIGLNWLEAQPAEDLGEAIGAALVMILIVVALMFLGLLIGSAIAAAYFARKLRLRSGEISRARGLAIGIVWLLGGLLTGVGFVVGLNLTESITNAL